jgi:hypothetical protein
VATLSDVTGILLTGGRIETENAPMANSISRKSILPLILAVSLASAAGCTAPLLTPTPISSVGGPEATRAAILRALAEEDFVFVSERPGEIVARYGDDDWNMVVAVDYAQKVSIRYVSSENLRYRTDDGTPVIRRGYNGRVQRLADQIGSELMIARIATGMPAVAAPPPGEAQTD